MKKLLAPLGAMALLFSLGATSLAQTPVTAVKSLLVGQDKMDKKAPPKKMTKKAPAKKGAKKAPAKKGGKKAPAKKMKKGDKMGKMDKMKK